MLLAISFKVRREGINEGFASFPRFASNNMWRKIKDNSGKAIFKIPVLILFVRAGLRHYERSM